MTRHRLLREEVVATARAMNEHGLNQGTSGNVSARIEGGMLITPSGMPYERMRPEDVVEVTWRGEVRGEQAPSTEWPMHLAILMARSDAGAVLHAHAMFATTLACLGKSIPPFHYMVAVAGGRDIRCGSYATFGSVELAEVTIEALVGRRACLLANHGMVALGAGLEQALRLAVEVETLAAQYSRVLQVGVPQLIPDAEMDRVLEKFSTYGTNVTHATVGRFTHGR